MSNSSRSARGLTLIELMIIVVIIGILAAIAIPNFIGLQNSQKEGSTKANMHTVQLSCEDYGIRNDGAYATVEHAQEVLDLLPDGHKNAFTGAPKDVVFRALTATDTMPNFRIPSGQVVVYTNKSAYRVYGGGRYENLALWLSSGQ